jgi:hypothetical protein
MFPFDRALDGWAGLAWLGGLIIVAFLVTWLATDVGGIRRRPFIAVLGVVTGGATLAYLGWTGAGSRFWTYHWTWGLLGSALVSGVMLMLVRRLPRLAEPTNLGRLFAWEGTVYGVAEGMLLSVLPVAISWQIGRSFGWAVAVGVIIAIVSSVAVIAIHHLGYPEFRNRMMRYPVIMCAALSIAYLVTSNPMAPLVGHVVLHIAMLSRGIVLPPHPKAEGFEQTLLQAA